MRPAPAGRGAGGVIPSPSTCECSVVPRVRRLTGGGAILHHHEWTYSFAVPPQQPLFRRPEELYDLVHAAIIEMLAPRGVTLRFREEEAVTI